MKMGVITAVLTFCTSFPALSDGAGVKWPDCYCTDRTGARVELGETVCMYVDGRSFTARCEMSLNNPMWRDIGDSCLSSRNGLPQSLDPAFDAGAVNAKI